VFLFSLFHVVNHFKNSDKKTWQGPTARIRTRTKPQEQGRGPDKDMDKDKDKDFKNGPQGVLKDKD